MFNSDIYRNSINTNSQATMWDRAYGGSTMVLHVDGTTVPGTPVLPEYLKADVYLPPHLIEELPERHHAIGDIVQIFIENVGIPTVSRWAAAARNLGWSLTQTGRVPIPAQHHPHTIPQPAITGSAHYIFHGRPYNSFQVPVSVSAAAITLPSSHYSDEPDSEMMLIATEKISELEAQLEQSSQMEQELKLQIVNLHDELAMIFFTLSDLEAKLALYENHGSTPSSSKPMSPAPLRGASPFPHFTIPPSTPQTPSRAR
jgi:hypothetical protein